MTGPVQPQRGGGVTMYMEHDGPPDTKPRGSSGYLPGGVSGEKAAPTAEEIAAARQHAAMLRDRFPERTRIENVAVALLAALDAAEAERKDAIGALDDAGVRRNDGDEVASGIESLAADRYEFSELWTGVCDLFWPDREPDDCFGIEDVREAVEEREQRGDAAEARAAAAEKDATDAYRAQRENGAALVLMEARAETAERERDEARALAVPPGAIVVRDDEETRERIAESVQQFTEESLDGVWRVRAEPSQVADAVLAALKEAPRG